MVATVLLLGLVAIAAVTDLLRHKIYNWTTYSGMLTALGLSTAGSALVRLGWVGQRRLESLGWISPWQSLLGLLCCGLVMLVCFVLFKIGGGDVKLIAMLGSFLGPEQGIETMLWTFVLGACMALILLLWRVGPLRLASCVFRQLLWTLRLRFFDPLTEAERARLQPPLFLAPSALVAVVLVSIPQYELLRSVIR